MPPTTAMRRFGCATVVVALASALGCQGNRSDKPPIHLQQNMDFQQRYDAQERNDFFADHRAMRAPVPGTVAIAHLRDNEHAFAGRGLDGRLVDALPAGLTLDEELLARGKERYDIYCAPCHGPNGDGDGIATRRGGGFKVKPPTYHQDRLRAMPLGYFFDVMTRGRGTMLSYAGQVPEPDRWAIAVWLRTLQLSQGASDKDVPPEVLSELQANAGGQGGAQ